MSNANAESADLLIIVIVLGCVVAILILSLAVTCGCLCRYQLFVKKTRVARGQIKKKPTTDANKVTTTKGQNIDDSRPKESDDSQPKPSVAYFYHKPADAESQQIITRVKVNDSLNRFGASAINWPATTGYQPALPWPRIAVSGTATAANCGRWNPAQEGRVVLNGASWNVQQGSSAVPVCVGGENQSSEFRPSQTGRVVLNALPGSYSQGEGTHATVLYPILS